MLFRITFQYNEDCLNNNQVIGKSKKFYWRCGKNILYYLTFTSFKIGILISITLLNF